jgi:hypothetical protein
VDMDLQWIMGTDGYEFSREPYKCGIIIKTNPNDEFHNVVIPGNGQSISIKFRHQSKRREYAYALTVRRLAGKASANGSTPG